MDKSKKTTNTDKGVSKNLEKSHCIAVELEWQLK